MFSYHMQCTNNNRVRTILSQFDNVVKKDYVGAKVSNFRQKLYSGTQDNTKQTGVSSSEERNMHGASPHSIKIV
jgi:hypothetical protein